MVDVDVGEQETSAGRRMDVGMWKKKGWDGVCDVEEGVLPLAEL
jgi:hypothetical protein